MSSSTIPTDPGQLEGIAIVAMSGRFPGAHSVQEFWQNLVAGRETISAFQEAEIMDPQHRLFLECSWETLDSAGYDSESYKLNLRGPSMSNQTACSSSLVAISQACTSLLTYQCDMALAGGVSISFPQEGNYLHQEEGMVSADGTCRTFDTSTHGTVFGHGVAVVLLKRLADAVADGDQVLAVIKGSATNNDGSEKIDFANSPFYPVTHSVEWKRGAKPLRAGVSAFGVGGTNVHVVVEEAPLLPPSGPSRPQQLLVLSAKTETALQAMSERLAAHLDANPSVPLADVAFTLQQGRRAFPFRRSIVASNHQEAAARLRQPDSKSDHQAKALTAQPGLVFLFPGQGAQYVEMGRELYEGESVFRAAVDRCAGLLQTRLGLDIRRVLYPSADQRGTAETEINQTWVTQPSIFVVDYALAQLWLSWGIKPRVLLGHSIGDYVAAVLAETFTLEAALDLLAARGKLMQNLPPGSMLAVRLSGEEVIPLLPDGAAIAAFNSPKLCTVSGPTPRLEEFQKVLESRKIASRFLPTSHAYHSSMMDPMLPEFTALAAKAPHQPPQLAWTIQHSDHHMLIRWLQ